MIYSMPIYEPTPELSFCHAATVAEAPGGELVAAWHGGVREPRRKQAIWLACFDGQRWSEPSKVADQPDEQLWNPVLFRDAGGTLWLFYKVGRDVWFWTGVYIKSRDGGRTWSTPTALPAGLVGPTKNKPIALSNGHILCGSSSESWHSWSVWVEDSADGGRTWTRRGPIVAPGQGEPAGEPGAAWDGATHDAVLPKEFLGLIQPALWEYAPGKLKMLLRPTRTVGMICAATSGDYGCTWSPVTQTSIPNPNSGLDAVRLADGRIVLICNPTQNPDQSRRTPLSLFMSADNGETWPWRRDLETGQGEFSYPSIIQAADGRLHAVYTWEEKPLRYIKHAVLDPAEIG